MFNQLKNFKTFPKSVKNAIVFVFFQWILLSILFYVLFANTEFPIREIGAGVLCCLAVITFKSWARILCILSNIMIIIISLTLFLAFFMGGEMTFAIYSVFIAIIFSCSTYFLFLKETAIFFKNFSKNDKNE